MIISAASRSACFSAFARRSARSTLPSRSQPTTTTFSPAIAALAGLVPCAEDGIRHTSRCCSPRDSCQARITSSPAYSPCEPAFGCSDTAAKPVAAHSQFSSRRIRVRKPAVWSAGANGWMSAKPGRVIAIISAVAFSFIVQDPSGIMLRFSAMSLSSRRFR